MSATVPCYVKVARLANEWIEVSAVTLDEARDIAAKMPGIAIVLDARYDQPIDDDDYIS